MEVLGQAVQLPEGCAFSAGELRVAVTRIVSGRPASHLLFVLVRPRRGGGGGRNFLALFAVRGFPAEEKNRGE